MGVQSKLSFYQHLTSKSSAKVRMNGNGPSMSGFRLTTESDPISREALQPTANYILSKIKVSHCAPRRHEGAGLLPRHQPVPGGHLSPHCSAPQPSGGP